MPVGHLAYQIECQTSPSYTVSVAPCVDISGSFYQPVVIQNYAIDSASLTYFEGLAVDFDYGLASSYFAFAFTGVFLMWWLGHVAGRIIDAMWD